MLTLAEFVALTGLLITVFSLGYKLGRDSVAKKQPPSPWKDRRLFFIVLNFNWAKPSITVALFCIYIISLMFPIVKFPYIRKTRGGVISLKIPRAKTLFSALLVRSYPLDAVQSAADCGVDQVFNYIIVIKIHKN